MRPLALSLLVSSLLAIITSGAALAQSAPQFRMGFASLAIIIPDVIGLPLEGERYDPVTGDALQRTTNGVLVWRKSDNVTAFTNGQTTWLLGPLGLQTRPNNTRFDWERPASLSYLPTSAAEISFSRGDDGTWRGTGTIRNALDEAMDVQVDVVAYRSPGGTPIMDAPTQFFHDLLPGESRSLSVRVPTREEVGDWIWIVTSRPSSARLDGVVEVGSGRGLTLDHKLAGAANALLEVDGGGWLLRVAAENGVRVRSYPTPPGVLAEYNSFSNLVTISPLLDGASSWVRATVLAHELQHAADDAADRLPRNPEQCYQFEEVAFQREAQVWQQLWRGHLPADVDPLHRELNDVAEAALSDRESFARQVANMYKSECSALRW